MNESEWKKCQRAVNIKSVTKTQKEICTISEAFEFMHKER